jgi:hypothetical protein
MKSIFLKMIYVVAGIATIVLPSCNTKELTNLNKNPNRIEEANPDYIFTGALLNMPATNGNLSQGMQYTSMYNAVGDVGGKQFTFPTSYGFGIYTGQLNRLQQCLDALKPTDVNKIALVKILRVDAYHRLTDVTGDVPYSEAAKGLEGNYKPKYDTQQDIYNAMFKELDEAATSLDGTKPTFAGADVIYNGDVTKWKKFAYTLMLRLAMHLTKVDPATAKTWAQKAIAGGVMTAIADIAYLKYNANNQNPRAPWNEYGNTQDGDNANGYKWSSTFIDHLKNTKDPRLGVLSVVWKPTGTSPVVYVPDTNRAVQKGMVPGGVFGKTADFATYSEPSPIWWNRDTSPLLLLGPAEAYLLLAEAALRGWYTGATEKELYDLAVTRGMQQWALWPNVTTLSPNNSTISQAQISSYLLNGYPYKTTGTFQQRLEQIATQKWVTLFGDDYEVFASWRLTGYPVMSWKNWLINGVPSAYPGSVTGGQMWRRLPYPDETLTNNENQQEALKRQGFPLDVKVAPADLLLGRVWWDKP